MENQNFSVFAIFNILGSLMRGTDARASAGNFTRCTNLLKKTQEILGIFKLVKTREKSEKFSFCEKGQILKTQVKTVRKNQK